MFGIVVIHPKTRLHGRAVPDGCRVSFNNIELRYYVDGTN